VTRKSKLLERAFVVVQMNSCMEELFATIEETDARMPHLADRGTDTYRKEVGPARLVERAGKPTVAMGFRP
jgi:hypothetical protein